LELLKEIVAAQLNTGNSTTFSVGIRFEVPVSKFMNWDNEVSYLRPDYLAPVQDFSLKKFAQMQVQHDMEMFAKQALEVVFSLKSIQN